MITRDNMLAIYGIDVDKDNIFTLYGIDSPDISDAQLDSVCEEKRKKWEKSIKSTNFAPTKAKFQERLDNVGKYETILKNKKLRKELWAYYKTEKTVTLSEDVIQFFTVASLSHKLTEDDVAIYFEIFNESTANHQVIKEYASKSYKLQHNSRHYEFVFEQPVLALLRKVFNCQRILHENELFMQTYPELSFESFLLKEMNNASGFETLLNSIREKRTEVYNRYRYSKNGKDFEPVLNFYYDLEHLLEIAEGTMVMNAYGMFKSIVKYEKIVPYVYIAQPLTAASAYAIYEVARDYYRINNISEFTDILKELAPVFKMDTESLDAVIQKLKKRPKSASIKAFFTRVLVKITLDILFLPSLLSYLLSATLGFIGDNFKKIRMFVVIMGVIVIPFCLGFPDSPLAKWANNGKWVQKSKLLNEAYRFLRKQLGYKEVSYAWALMLVLIVVTILGTAFVSMIYNNRISLKLKESNRRGSFYANVRKKYISQEQKQSFRNAEREFTPRL